MYLNLNKQVIFLLQNDVYGISTIKMARIIKKNAINYKYGFEKIDDFCLIHIYYTEDILLRNKLKPWNYTIFQLGEVNITPCAWCVWGIYTFV